jgi:hypothetical protein
MPSDEVITLLVVPDFATATNNDNSGDQQTQVQLKSLAETPIFQSYAKERKNFKG